MNSVVCSIVLHAQKVPSITLSGHKGAVTTAVFNSSGNRVVTAGEDSTAKI